MTCKHGRNTVGERKGLCRTKSEAFAQAKSLARLLKRAGTSRQSTVKRIRDNYGLSAREADSMATPYFGRK